MKLYLLSDLHTELAGPYRLTKPHNADCLALLGDIGHPTSPEYQQLLDTASKFYTHVFVVLGNHEYYGSTKEDTEGVVGEICGAYGNVNFLQNSAVDVCAVRVIGTTLWSDIPDDSRSEVGVGVNDFRGATKGWGIDAHNYHHSQAVSFIGAEIALAKAEGKRLVVLTHHSPLPGSNPKYVGDEYTCAFETDLRGMMVSPPVCVWCFGHTHYSMEKEVNGVRCVSNQRGYLDEKGTGFDPESVVDLDAL